MHSLIKTQSHRQSEARKTIEDMLSGEMAKQWKEIWVVIYHPRKPYTLNVGLTAYELISQKEYCSIYDKHYPFDLTNNSDILFITDNAIELLQGFNEMGLPYPYNIYDIFISFQSKDNSTATDAHNNLILHCLSHYGLDNKHVVNKEICDVFNYKPFQEYEGLELTKRLNFNSVLALSLLSLYMFEDLEGMAHCDFLRTAFENHPEKISFHKKLRNSFACYSADMQEDFHYSCLDYDSKSPKPDVLYDEYYINKLYEHWKTSDSTGIVIP